MPRGGPRTNSGGTRKGAGRPRQRLVLDKGTAHTLALLTRIQQQVAPATTEEMVIANLVDDAWQETNGEYEQAESGVDAP